MFTNNDAERFVNQINFDKEGLVPVVVEQLWEILKVAYVNKLALQKTIETGYAHFWDRSKNEVQKEGESSGNIMYMELILIDCEKKVLKFFVNTYVPFRRTLNHGEGRLGCFTNDHPRLDFREPNRV